MCVRFIPNSSLLSIPLLRKMSDTRSYDPVHQILPRSLPHSRSKNAIADLSASIARVHIYSTSTDCRLTLIFLSTLDANFISLLHSQLEARECRRGCCPQIIL